MEIKKTNLKVTDRMELNPIDVNNINEPKKLLGMTPKFKTMYLKRVKDFQIMFIMAMHQYLFMMVKFR